ncbi:hypothetical protein [Bartonella sp. DGB1]|uniref:hypothetical protein n=1 Tax=Bartonella sp. DGB1 TaxID=3239807 RepID=UPI00352384A1
MKKSFTLIFLSIFLSACILGSNFSSSIIRTSADMIIINVKVNDRCSFNQIISTTQKVAALETLKAGYDSYIIRQVKADSFYLDTKVDTELKTPIPTFKMSGSHKELPDRYHTVIIQMFDEAKGKSNNAISAKAILGANWKDILQQGEIYKCE